MRVLLVDQDSAMLEAIVRALRERYTVDAVTNKGDCLDLLRQNTFEVIVAGERLEDGSGLELLGQVAKRWPAMLRIFAADRHRLQLLKGRLGPFELFQTLSYPVDPERLLATLTLADAAQDANADTSNIQHVVLGGDTVFEEASAFPAPRPEPRVAPPRDESPRPAAARSVTRAAAPSPVRSLKVGGGVAPRAAPALAAVSGRSRGASHRRPTVRFPPLEPGGSQQSSAESISAAADSLAAAAVMARQATASLDPLPEEEPQSRRTAMLIAAGAVAVLGLILLGFRLSGPADKPAARAATPAVKVPQYPHEVTDLVGGIEAALKQDDYQRVRNNVEKLHAIAPSYPRLPFFDSLLARHNDSSTRVSDSQLARQAQREETKRPGHPPRRANAAGLPDKPVTSRTVSPSSPAPPPGAGSAIGSAATADFAAPAARVSSEAATARAGSDSVEPVLPPETPAGMSLATPTTAAPAVSVASASASASAAAPAPGTASASAPGTASAPAAAVLPATQTVAVTSAGSLASATQTASVASAGSTASATPPQSPDELPPVIREPKLIRRVNAQYPTAAKRDGIEGSVDLDVTVSKQGSVEDVAVAHSDPPGVFDKAALAAVRRYKYDPRFVDGLPVEAHLRVHLEFKPDSDNR